MTVSNQWETVKQQCAGFNEAGYVVKCEPTGIRIARGLKTWQFSDPDPDIIIKQLAQLWKVVYVKEKQKH